MKTQMPDVLVRQMTKSSGKSADGPPQHPKLRGISHLVIHAQGFLRN